MERVCFQLQVRPDKIVEYEERHRSVWPEMQQALRESGWTNYSLFLRDDGLLIGYLETENFAAAVENMQNREINGHWQCEMAAFFQNPDILINGSGFQRLREVFHFD
jgi:L-rhamnose mutarotase